MTAWPGVGHAVTRAWSQRRFDLVTGAVLAIVGLAAYANSLQVPLQFDDVDGIVNKGAVHMERLDWSSIRRATQGFPARRWLANLSFAFNYLGSGLAPFGYHLVNLAFHLGTAWLVYLLALEFLELGSDLDGSRRRRAALVTGLFFVSHPVHTQAVTYVIQRMASMGAFFGFLCVLLYVRARRPGVARPGLLLSGSALTAFLAFSCKESFAVLPLLLLLIEGLFRPGLDAKLQPCWKLGTALSGALALFGAIGLWQYWDFIERESKRYGLSSVERLLSQGRILTHYLSLLAWPWPGRLHVDYAYQPSTGLFEPLTTLPALAFMVGLAGLAVRFRREVPLLSFGLAWFVIALLIEQSILPIDLVFEHRLYFPSFGLLAGAAYGLERWLGRQPWRAVLAASVVTAALVFATVARNGDWSDPLRLYGDEESRGPGHARALLNLADGYRNLGQFDQAEAVLEEAVRLEPSDPSAFVNLGLLADQRGRPDSAEVWLRRAIDVEPRASDAWYHLGDLLLGERRYAEADLAYQRTLALDPVHFWAHVNRGQVLRAEGLPGQARWHYDVALRIDPTAAIVWLDRALAFLEERRPGDALADALQATRLAPGDALAAAVLGDALAALGRHQEAVLAYRRALGLDPREGRARAGLRALGE